MAREFTFGAGPERLRRLLFEGMEEPEGQEDVTLSQADDSAPSEGEWIGNYRLIRPLGEGGMGIVYLAQQKQPIRREVALKVIKPGLDSKRVMARFEAERQALALLDHPNIAHVYEAGMTQTGRPYFVMEYVQGISITDHCDHHKLTIEQRLCLFQQVCLAVQHAHQKGIIHRDIKPSNILVLVEDNRAIPKIIDFGVAKALAQPLTERTLATEESQLLGTPEYMSPEQADMANKDIDTRSDIYSLGVLLYVLLTGVLPFDSDTLREGGIENIRKTIRETDPKTPSTRLTKLGEEATAIAQNRRIEIQILARNLRKELEWIPLKAMRKECSERYRSASELADDIENYLNGAPLIAGPLGNAYRIKKFVRRNRAFVTGIAAVLAILVIGVIASTFFAIRAEHARAGAQAFSDFLQNGIEALTLPEQVKGTEVSMHDLLTIWSKRLESSFDDKPLIEASMRSTLGWAYRYISEPKVAEPHLERALQIYQKQLGPEHPLTLNSVDRLAWLRWDQGLYTEAAELAEKSLLTSRRMLGDEHEITLTLANTLGCMYSALGQYDEAEQLYSKSIQTARQVLGEKNNRTLKMISNLGGIYEAQGRYDDAESRYLEWLHLYDGASDDGNSLRRLNFLARVYIDQKRYEEAKKLYLEILPIQRRVVGGQHWHTLGSMSGLAQVHIHLGEYNEAETLLREVLNARRLKLGEDHPLTLETISYFGVLRREQKRYDEAELLLRQALDGRQRKLGNEHPGTLESKNDLAVLYKEQGDYDKAERFLLEALKGRRVKLGDTHPHTIESWHNLIALYQAWGKPEHAEQWKVNLSESRSRP